MRNWKRRLCHAGLLLEHHRRRTPIYSGCSHITYEKGSGRRPLPFLKRVISAGRLELGPRPHAEGAAPARRDIVVAVGACPIALLKDDLDVAIRAPRLV